MARMTVYMYSLKLHAE